jgi:uncharacterized membrane protein
MESRIGEAAVRFLKKTTGELSESEQRVLHRFVERKHIARSAEEIARAPTRGERIADTVASFGGSWTFIIIFGSVMLLWILVNSILLVRLHHHVFDPFPYILLNLVLSMLAAIQAPIIMMSQNRQAARDRMDAAHDYEVNLKAELEILSLHEKVDLLREQQWAQLLAVQQRQIELLENLAARAASDQT